MNSESNLSPLSSETPVAPITQPAQPQMTQPTIMPMTPVVPKKNKLLLPLLGLLILILLIGAAVIFYLQSMTPVTPVIISTSNTPNTQPKTDIVSAPVVDNTPTGTTGGDLPLSQTYTSPTGTFTFNYPSDWTVYDSANNQNVFTVDKLDGDNNVLLQKGNDMLFIQISPYASGTEVGGIFLTQADLTAYQSNHTGFMMKDGTTYYLYENHTSLADFTSPSNESGIFGAASLSEFVPNKTSQYDGYNDFIQNRRGYSYAFVKLSKTDTGKTSDAIQAELVSILQTITW